MSLSCILYYQLLLIKIIFGLIEIAIDNSIIIIHYIITQHLTKKGNKEATCQEPANTQTPILHVKTIDRHLAQVDLNKIARSTKFFQRTPQKVTAFAFVKSLCNAAYQEIFSYSKVAFLLGLLGINISKQGVSDRINHHGVAFLKQVLNAIIQDKLFNEIVSSILFSNALDNEQTEKLLEHAILRHCCYEKRKNRLNYYEQLNQLCRLA